MTARTLERPGVEFNVVQAADGVIARLVCDCGHTLCEEHVLDADPDEVEADGGAELRRRLLWGEGLILCCAGCGRIVRGRGGVS